MLAEHHPLTAEEVLVKGGWHPRYARVIAVTSDGDYGLALIDGNGDGQELEAEVWTWQEGIWMANGSSGTGPLRGVGPVRSGGQIDNAYFAPTPTGTDSRPRRKYPTSPGPPSPFTPSSRASAARSATVRATSRPAVTASTAPPPPREPAVRPHACR